MITVANDVKIMFRRYCDTVSISTTEDGRIILFNHNNISPCPAGVFTGIDFELPSWITPKVTTIEDVPVATMFWKKCMTLRCPDNKKYDEPIAYVSFLNRDSGFIFNGHLIELGGK